MITNTINTFSTVLSTNSKVLALETTLQQSLLDFKELLLYLEQLHVECDNYKVQYMKQKEKCESETCKGVNNLKKVIEAKDNIIQLIASTLTRLNETKNWAILDEVFKILCGDTTTESNENNIECKDIQKISTIKEELISPKKELHSSNEELLVKDESMSEIEGTPTGRTSPIIQTKKLKSSVVTSFERDKKKCPNNWPTPEKKTLKLTFSTPTRSKQHSKLIQSRLNVVKVKTSNVIDITSSPEFSGGNRCNSRDTEDNVQLLVKKESIESDDTILPSPTSGPTNFTLFKSPMKFKKPSLLSLKNKTEKSSAKSKFADLDTENIKMERKYTEEDNDKKYIKDMKTNSLTYTQEDSVNVLQQNRLPIDFMKNSPIKREHNDTTFCDSQASVSLLQHVNKLEDLHEDNKHSSPSKRPLAENINITNMADDEELEASMSLLQRDAKPTRPTTDTVKRKLVEPIEIVHEDRAPRTREEKRQLPGWACEKCINFFGELYKDEPEMMKKKINECSHHRGMTNPERPKTPPGYWNPRWNIPENTEEFNKRNNVK